MGGRHPDGVTGVAMSTDPADGRPVADTSPQPTPTRSRPGLDLVVLLVAIGAGMIAALSPAEPTGSPGVDAVMVGIAVGAVVLIGALARPWAVIALSIAALVVAFAPLLLALAAVALGIAMWGRRTPRHQAELFAVSIGISLNVLARGELGGFLGLSALVAISMAAIVFVSGLRRQPRLMQRVTLAAIGVLAVAATAAVIGFGFTVLQTRNELSAGVRWAEQAVSQMESGDFETAAASFAAAADELAEAHDRLSNPIGAAAALIPVLAQHREAAIEMSGVGGSGAEVAAEALGGLDLESLRLIDGRIDLAALERLRGPFERTHRAMVEVADAATRSLRSPWLIGRAEYALRDFQGSVAEHLPSLDEAIEALDLAPRLLGVDRPQTYLVLLTTSAEAQRGEPRRRRRRAHRRRRGVGGCPGRSASRPRGRRDVGLPANGTARRRHLRRGDQPSCRRRHRHRSRGARASPRRGRGRPSVGNGRGARRSERGVIPPSRARWLAA